MNVQVLRDERVKARKHHRCFHCYRDIAEGVDHQTQTNLYDGRVYTLRFHDDCNALWDQYFMDADLRHSDYWDDVYPPLWDDWSESGELRRLCDQYRGFFPHVIARFEHNLSDLEERRNAKP